MNYFDNIKAADYNKIAIIEDGIVYTYGELTRLVISMGNELKNRAETQKEKFFNYVLDSNETNQIVYIICEDTIMEQLVKFLACNAIGIIPLIVPKDLVESVENNIKSNIENSIKNVSAQACMAVMTSGSRGIPKILYRTYESWADFFPIQNKIFGINKDSILFAQGSLAFTGNLNLYMAQFYVGATVVAENKFNPRRWVHIIEKENVNAIYLLPAKLMILSQAVKDVNENIRSILSGSQSLGKSGAQDLKRIFPKAEITLYYGASELSYITYVKDGDMTEAENLVGKPFPDVSVFIKEGEIYVDTKYHVEGIVCPYSISDRGYIDSKGRLYFEGRSDDIVSIHGRKVSLVRIENELEIIGEIEEAVVCLDRDKLVAFVTIKNNLYFQNVNYSLYNYGKYNDSENNKVIEMTGDLKKYVYNELRKTLAHFEMPCKIFIIENMPHNEKGEKVRKKF